MKDAFGNKIDVGTRVVNSGHTMNEIPESVTIYKHKLPKGHSHPVQTSDVLAVLDQEILDLKVGLHYGEYRPDTYKLHTRQLFSVVYRGDHNKFLTGADAEHWDRVTISVGVIKGEYRRATRQLFQKEILPFVADWIKKQIHAGVQNDSVLSVEYTYWYEPRGKSDKSWDFSEKKGMVLVKERKKHILKKYLHEMEKFD